MKILKIRIENIHSLKGVHKIDFSNDPLADAGLFAIAGATGSGKTSILDAISLSLYNRVPRAQEKISKNFIQESGLIMTRGSREASAEVTYECREGRYTSRWQIHKASSGNLQDYHMEIAEVETGKILDVQKSKVPAKNSELIGLNYEQFVRAIILAQGDFASFLKAKEEERGKLLEQITGGEIYRKLGKKAFEMYKEHGQELEVKKQQKKQISELLIPGEEYKLLLEALRALDEELITLKKKEQKTRDDISLKTELSDAIAGLEVMKSDAEKVKEELKAFERGAGSRLEKHRDLIPAQETLLEWKKKKSDEKSHAQDIESAKETQLSLGAKQKELKEEIARLTGEENADPVESLIRLQGKVIKLDTSISRESLLRDQKFNVLTGSASKLDMTIVKDEPEVFEEEIGKRIKGNEAEQGGLIKELGEEIVARPEESLENIRASQALVIEIIPVNKQLDERTGKRKNDQVKLTTIEKTLEELPDKIKAGEKQLGALKLECDNLKLEMDNRMLRASLEDKRKQLEPGKPCPLCGSLHHPLFEEGEKKADELEELFSHKDTKRANQEKELIQLGMEEENKGKEMKALREELEATGQAIKNETSILKTLEGQLPEEMRKMEYLALKEKLAADIIKIERLVRLRDNQTLMTGIPADIEEFKGLSKSLATLNRSRKALFSGDNIQELTGKMQNSWTTLGTNLKNAKERLTESEEHLEKCKEKIAGFGEILSPLIKKLGYSSETEALENLLSVSDAESLQQEQQQILDRKGNVKARISLTEKNIQKKREKESKESRKKLDEELKETGDLISERNGVRDGKVAVKKSQQDYLSKIKELDQAIQRLDSQNLKWNLLYRMIGDAEGKNFSSFAQRLTMYKLVLLANTRLKSLNDRYLLDIPKENEDESLSVVDTHMGDQRRSVKSLSGGETFLISLALALALSDLAARNIKINSLFIDEGFGSLDKLTLDQTIDTLEKLQYESGKSIGVISHVEAMQERITTQIQVRKNGQGYSKINIIS